MRIQFNTGRGYSASGQPITAVQYDDAVKFRDHARGITGTIPVVLGMRLDAVGLQEFVMWNYDRNNYTDAHWTEDELDWREGAMKILPTYGGTEWAADPCAVLVGPSYYDECQREANAIFKAHPKIDKVCFGYVGDVSLFLDTTTDFDMRVVGVDEDGEMLYVREEWECTWRFAGLYVTRYSCWLEWYAKHGSETLTCDLDRLREES